MNELIIGHSKPKAARIFGIIAGGYFTAIGLYFTIKNLLAGVMDLWFILAAIATLFGIIILLQNVLAHTKSLLKIDNNVVEADIPPQKAIAIEWVNVSEVTFGVSYVVFLLNGQKQQKLDLGKLVYDDMRQAKSKITELCEFKNIPYKND
ncbi:hypothetical protein [Dysgonomonas sp. 25]|uniref:hypothetical protein n=1 Tax=Dysgonomonas sp. 25 TaxID=2302933 RepID=UPI0013D6426F|nr:hypothetical protein [Dysgonomonas sp. 25]NDV70079.1 hypothetical protein [Dysgonomonas sp. 25]